MDDFKDAPVSLTEIKAERSRRGDDWKPRDVLISLLREIDNGTLDIESIVVSYYDQNTNTAYYRQASEDRFTALGLLECAKFKLMES